MVPSLCTRQDLGSKKGPVLEPGSLWTSLRPLPCQHFKRQLKAGSRQQSVSKNADGDRASDYLNVVGYRTVSTGQYMCHQVTVPVSAISPQVESELKVKTAGVSVFEASVTKIVLKG